MIPVNTGIAFNEMSLVLRHVTERREGLQNDGRDTGVYKEIRFSPYALSLGGLLR